MARRKEVAEKLPSTEERRPPGLKPEQIPGDLRRPEGPLFHGDACIREFSATSEVVPFPFLLSVLALRSGSPFLLPVLACRSCSH